MKSVRERAVEVYWEEGPLELARRGLREAYDTLIRPRLPRRTGSFNGVTARAVHAGDWMIPWQSAEVPDYEAGIVRGIREHVGAGDTVVVVGGGIGVSTVAAANQAGPDGSVTVFDGGLDAVDRIRETVELNGVASRVSIRNAIVGEEIRLRGSGEAVPVVPPEELPACDVVVLDCEGAERTILETTMIRPGAVVVETHDIFDAPKDLVEDLLADAGYEVTDCRVAEERMRELCIERGIYVLTATQ